MSPEEINVSRFTLIGFASCLFAISSAWVFLLCCLRFPSLLCLIPNRFQMLARSFCCLGFSSSLFTSRTCVFFTISSFYWLGSRFALGWVGLGFPPFPFSRCFCFIWD